MWYDLSMTILGIDEVGRGPWAGPLVIGAVILPENKPDWVNELTDSKKLTANKREALNEIILKEAPATGLGWVSSTELDEIGLSKALKLATRRAVEEIRSKKIPFHEIIIDGTQNFLVGTTLENYVTVLKKADFLIKEVSAASIIAKVARDHYMYDLAKKYPNYGFEKHVGYGTAAHRTALQTYGPCPEHRKSFKPLKNFPPVSEQRSETLFRDNKTKFPEQNETTSPREYRIVSGAAPGEVVSFLPGEILPITEKSLTSVSTGTKAESIVSNFLESEGHKIIVRNQKTKFYEIDIISVKDDKIYFTEVKYRKSQYRGTSLDQITLKKLQQMTFAAKSFLKFQPQFKNLQPILAAAAVSGEDFQLNAWFPIVN